MQELSEAFAKARLPEPPIPDALRPGLMALGPWNFGTRPMDAMDMYLFDAYLYEALCADVEPYVAVSHAGHGVSSYALNYHLVYGPLLLFVQGHFGGIYGDAERDRAELAEQFRECADLIAAVDRLGGAAARHPRLFVAFSPMRQIAVCAPHPGRVADRHAANAWLTRADAWPEPARAWSTLPGDRREGGAGDRPRLLAQALHQLTGA
ncbi:hypothetical protein GCM10023205_27450 [Yinghuangia aomiensis]|uniref:Uracil DNA glycosylase superfamily protein n=1 Tax=Yinghuangia aomiensis TaxID=676205 RepID=A0ABP9H4T8_9ACTN